MSNTWKQKYDRMFEKARRKRQELEERIAGLESENARLAAMLGEIANYRRNVEFQHWKNWRGEGDD